MLFLFGALAGLPLFAAEEIPKLRPPRDLLRPSFWELHGGLILAGAAVVIGIVALVVWRLLRSHPPLVVPSDVIARQALDRLREQAEDVALVGEVSRIMRHYLMEVFLLQNDELTTEEMLKEVRACFTPNPALLAALGDLFRECDARKFAPVSPPPQGPLVNRALEFIVQLESHRHKLLHVAEAPPPLPAASSPRA